MTSLAHDRDPDGTMRPRSHETMEAACDRLIGALQTHLGTRLVAVLLSGSWARGEPRPGESDLDLSVIVDMLDEAALEALRLAWIESEFGVANHCGVDEVEALSREGMEQFTTNAVVLFGRNPFRPPTREDFTRDVGKVAESLSRYARSALVYPWLDRDRQRAALDSVFTKWELSWALRCVAALRTTEFPRTQEDLAGKLAGHPEEALLAWVREKPESLLSEHPEQVAKTIHEFARSWLLEAAAGQ